MVTLGFIGVAVAVKLSQVVFVIAPGSALFQAVGVMVRTDHDDGVIGNAGFFQPLHQIGHGEFQFLLSSIVAFDGGGGIQISHQIEVLITHGIAAPVVVTMAADGHVINAEGLLIDILIHRKLHHGQVALGPLLLDACFHAVAHAHKGGVAQIDVGLVAVIVGIAVVVISSGEIVQILKLVADGQEQILLGGFQNALAAAHGDNADDVGKFTGTGTAAPDGLVVIGKLDALVGQTIQGRCPFGINGLSGKGFRRNKNQVFALEKTRVLIFGGGGLRCHIFVQGGNGGSCFGFCQSSKVHVHYVVTQDNGLGFGFLGNGLLRFRFNRVSGRSSFCGSFRFFRNDENLFLGKNFLVQGIQGQCHVQTEGADSGVEMITLTEGCHIVGKGDHNAEAQQVEENAAGYEKCPQGPGGALGVREDGEQDDG